MWNTSWANDAYARSGVRFRLSLVGAEQVDFPDLNDENAPPFSLSEDELAAWYEELDAQYDGVFAIRDRVGADIISIVMDMGEYGEYGFAGYASLMQELSPDFESLAYNLVHVDHVSYTELAHHTSLNYQI